MTLTFPRLTLKQVGIIIVVGFGLLYMYGLMWPMSPADHVRECAQLEARYAAEMRDYNQSYTTTRPVRSAALKYCR